MTRTRDRTVRGVALAAVLLFTAYGIVTWTGVEGVWRAFPSLLMLVPLYLASHLLRGVRLFLVLYDGQVRLGQVVTLHFVAGAVSRLIPFKLGELVRIVAVARLIGDGPRALMSIWQERLFDGLLLLLVLAALLAAEPASWRSHALLMAFLAGFLFASFFVFLVLPEGLALLKRYLVTRHNSVVSLRLLKGTDRVHQVLARSSRLLRTRWASVTWLTLGIWSLEMGCLLVVLDHLPVGDGPPSLLRLVHEAILLMPAWPGATGGGLLGGLYRVGTLDALVVLATILAVLVALRPVRRKEG